MLDTNVIIKFLAGDEAAKRLLEKASDISVSVIVAGELQYGAQKSSRTESNLALFIRPFHGVGSEFSEQILADLISQGYGGQELLLKFKEYSRAVRPAVRKLIDEADAYAKSGEGSVPMGELFGTEG